MTKSPIVNVAFLLLVALAVAYAARGASPVAATPRDLSETEQKLLDSLSLQAREYFNRSRTPEHTESDELAYQERLLRAADVAAFLDLDRAEAEACSLLADTFMKALAEPDRQRLRLESADAEQRDERELAERTALANRLASRAQGLFQRAVVAARRSGDTRREIHALNGLLAVFRRSVGDEGREPFMQTLRAYADIAASTDRIIDALPALAYSATRPRWFVEGMEANLLRGIVGFSMDDVAAARLMGDRARLESAIPKLIERGLVLTAGKLAEEVGDPPGLLAVFAHHRTRGDAVAESRVGRRLLSLLPDGAERADVQRRTFVAALAADDLQTAADTAANPTLAASLRGGAIARSQDVADADAAVDETDQPEWLRRGRSPPQGDAFTNIVSESLLGDPGYIPTLHLIDFAQADGSHAFVAPLFAFVLGAEPGHATEVAHAAAALVELVELQDLPSILRALGHWEWETRRCMAMALGRLQGQDEDLTDLLQSRLDIESVPAVRAALRWGLIRAGRFEENLDALADLLDGDDVSASITAAVALFDHGYGTAAAKLGELALPDSDEDQAEEAAQLLGFSERPDAIPLIERFLNHKGALVQEDASRALNQHDSPQAREARGRGLLRVRGGMSRAFLGLRDGRRGLLDPEALATLVRWRNEDNLARFAYQADLSTWLIGESMGRVRFNIPVGKDAHTKTERLALRGLEERMPYPWRGQHGSDMVLGDEDDAEAKEDSDDDLPSALPRARARARARRAVGGGPRTVSMVYEASLSGAVVVITLDPLATLVDESYLTVDLRKTQRHSGFDTGLYGPLWVNFELKLEAEGALIQARIEGLPGGPYFSDSAHVPTFDLPHGVTTADVAGGRLVLDFKFFDKTETASFPLGPRLVRGDEIKPDLIVERVSVDPAAPRPGAPVEVLFDVVNVGHARSRPTHAVVYAHNVQWPAAKRPIGRIAIPSLDQGDRVETAMGVSVSSDYYLNDYTPGWTPEDQDTSIEVEVDPDGAVEELDEGNNSSARPVAFILTEDEREARQKEDALSRLGELVDQLEELGLDADPEVLREPLRELLEEFESAQPRTPALATAIRMIRALSAQDASRERIRDAVRDMSSYAPADDPEEQEQARLLAELLRAQADLLRSGVPVSPEQIAAIDENVKAFRENYGEDYPLFGAEQAASFEDSIRAVRVQQGLQEIFGAGATGTPGDLGAVLGPQLNPERRAAAEQYLRRNIEWNHDGIDYANATFDRIMSAPDNWFEAEPAAPAPGRWATWDGPDADIDSQLEFVDPADDPAPMGPPAKKTIKTLQERFGF